MCYKVHLLPSQSEECSLFIYLFLQFRQTIGGLCTWSIYTCTGQKNENNWMFSQHVCLKGAKEIFVNVTYTFDQCKRNSNCDDEFLTLHKYDVKNTVSDKTETNNYTPMFGSIEESKIGTAPGDKITKSLIRDPESTGMYVGIQDTGTCGQISRIIMYYKVCNAKQVGLVRYPEFPAPPTNGEDEIFEAECVCNAHPVTSMAVTASSKTGQCSDVASGGARCECDAGYVISADGRSCESKWP